MPWPLLLPFGLFAALAMVFSLLAWFNVAGEEPGARYRNAWRVLWRGPFAGREHFTKRGWTYWTLSFGMLGCAIVVLLLSAAVG